jgi:homoserine kinase type II
VKGYPQVIKVGSDQDYIQWLEFKYRDLMRNIPSGLPSGLIHGDLFFDNVIFEGKKFKAILDFEDVCHYFKAFDIGMAIVGLCREGTSVALRKAGAFTSGYQEIRRLKGEERESLQAFTEFAAILTSAWRYWKYNIDTPIAKKADHHWQMVKVANDVNKIPKERLLEALIN